MCSLSDSPIRGGEASALSIASKVMVASRSRMQLVQALVCSSAAPIMAPMLRRAGNPIRISALPACSGSARLGSIVWVTAGL